MKFLIATLLTFSLSSYAQDCTYTIKSQDVKLKWTAFKTPLKKGVPGSFNKYGIKKQYSGKTLREALTSVKFSIDTKSVNTKNEARDAKIAKFFFGNMAGDKITGRLKSWSKKVLTVELTMNGITKDVPLEAEVEGNEFIAEGHIDVLDFSLAKSLAGINKACLELHQGKTWSDVELELKAKFLKSCK